MAEIETYFLLIDIAVTRDDSSEKFKILLTGEGFSSSFIIAKPVTFGICSVLMDTVPDISRESTLSLYRVVWLCA